MEKCLKLRKKMYSPNPQKILAVLRNRKKPDEKEVDKILTKAENLGELNLDEVFTLLQTEGNENLTIKIFSTARKIRDNVIGKVVYLPVPLYVSNYCQNDCTYCANRRSNKIVRTRLSEQELVKEVQALIFSGFRIIELVFGEDQFFTPERIAAYVGLATRKIGKSSEIVLNIAPTNTEGFKIIEEAGVDRVVQWQETYDQKRYAMLHPVGNKSDFDFRVQAYERMLEAGIKNIGIGVLFGLADYRFDVLSLIDHVRYLRDKYDISPIIGIPRLKEAQGASYNAGGFEVTDEQLKLAVAVYRLALPYSNIFISTRESMNLMLDLLDCGGGTLLATKCSVNVGYEEKNCVIGQFKVHSYDPVEVSKILKEKGFIPSFKKPPYNLV